MDFATSSTFVFPSPSITDTSLCNSAHSFPWGLGFFAILHRGSKRLLVFVLYNPHLALSRSSHTLAFGALEGNGWDSLMEDWGNLTDLIDGTTAGRG